MKGLYSKCVLVVLLAIGYQLATAQVTNFGNLNVQNGAVLYIDNSLDNKVGATIDNNGTIQISGDLNNSGTPTLDKHIVLYGSDPQSITGNTVFTGVIEVDKSGNTAIVSSGTVEVDSILRLNSGTMNANGNVVIRSTNSLTGLVDDFSSPSYDGTLTGNLRMQRYVPTAGFHYIGSAVNNASVSELSELGLYGPDGGQLIPQPDCAYYALAYGSPYGVMFEWHEDGSWLVPGCQQSGWFVRSLGNMTNARGYAIIAGAGQTLEIGGGVANTSEVSTVSYNGLANTNATGDGWHLVSNPFPSPMVWFAPPAGFDAQAHFWQTSGSYNGTYQAILPSPAALISSSQAFYVRASAGPANFALPQSYRSLGNPAFFKEDLANTFDIIVEADGFADKTRVRFGDDGETNNFDSMLDANKIKAPGAQPTLKTRLRGVDYAINSLSLEDHPMTVPMDLIPGISGEFKFTAKLLEQFTVEAHVYLEDLKKNVIQELTVNPVYTFTADESDDPERFLLHFRLNGEEPLYTGDDIVMYAHDNSAYLFLPELEGRAQLEVFSAIGELVYFTSDLYEGKNQINLDNLATGTYILRALVNNKPITKKVIL
ncbi:MAG: hypothetical protein RL266_1704 [Bacteroidota bacterium]